jgi:hypothetical protein
VRLRTGRQWVVSVLLEVSASYLPASVKIAARPCLLPALLRPLFIGGETDFVIFFFFFFYFWYW